MEEKGTAIKKASDRERETRGVKSSQVYTSPSPPQILVFGLTWLGFWTKTEGGRRGPELSVWHGGLAIFFSFDIVKY